MDPLSVTASIIAILQLTSKVIEYLNDVKDAPKDRAQCAIEASNLYNLLTTLRYRLEEGTSNEPWHAAVRALSVKNGPLDQYKLTLEQLQAKITGEGGIRKVGHFLLWKFVKEEVMEILARIERLKTLVQIALEMDHLLVSLSEQKINLLTLIVNSLKQSERVSMQFSKIKTVTGTTKPWNGYLQPTFQLSSPISPLGDKKELVYGSLTLLSLLSGFMDQRRLSSVLASPEPARQ